MKKLSSLLLLFLLVATAANAKFTYWGYADKNITDCYGKIGLRQGKAAIYVPAEVAQMYKGLKVTGVRAGLSDPAETLRVFVTTDLNAAYIAEKDNGTGNKGLNVVKFDTPYTITGEPFYVGYEFTSNINVIGRTEDVLAGANFTDLGEGWTDNVKNNDKGATALAIQMRVEGTTLPTDVALYGVKPALANVGATYEIKGKLLNHSTSKLNTVRIGYKADDEAEQFADIDTDIAASSEGEFSITCNAPESKGLKKLAVRIVEANGAADDYAANNTYNTEVITANLVRMKRALMEEFTGINCPYCVRGIVGIDRCKERFGEKFVAIAKHSYEQTPGLTTVHYTNGISDDYYQYNINGGFPKSIIDRKFTTDPGPDKAPTYVQAALNQGTSAYIDAFGFFSESNTAVINATAVASFNSDQSNGKQFRFAFAVIENDVKGYKQRNAYYGTSVDMDGWEKLPSPTDVVLQHVARWGESVGSGFKNSVPDEVRANEPVYYSMTINMPEVQNYRNLKLIAILLRVSTTNGTEEITVENVVEVPIYERQPSTPPTAIRDLNTVETPEISVVNGSIEAPNFGGTVRVFTADGKAVANTSLKPGMYIVKLCKGKQTFVKKIIL